MQSAAISQCPAFIADLYGPLISFSLGYPRNSLNSSHVPHCAPLTIPLNIAEVSAGTCDLLYGTLKMKRQNMCAYRCPLPTTTIPLSSADVSTCTRRLLYKDSGKQHLLATQSKGA
eukprot:scaffold63248_cov20-Tisochrysis_lutea.AAC.1